eukprot:gene21546-28539_t
MHVKVDPKKSAKQQALEVIPQLVELFPIVRARMRLRLTAPADKRAELNEILEYYDTTIESTDNTATTSSAVIQVEPGAFRDLHSKMQTTMQGKGGVEVLSMAVTATGVDADQFATEKPTSVSSSVPAAMAVTATGVDADKLATEKPTSVSSSVPAATAVTATGVDADQLATEKPKSVSSSVPAAVSRPPAEAPKPTPAREKPSQAKREVSGEVLYAQGPISNLPEAYASRKERFTELDTLQEGWTVELRAKGDTVEAAFFSPTGEPVGAYVNARRAALAAKKAASA